MKNQYVIFCFVTITLLISVPHFAFADNIDPAVEKAVELLKDRGLGKIKQLELIIEVSNKDTQEYDQEARIIQSSLYSNLQVKFPSAKLMLKEEALVGISGRAIKIKGTYQKRKGKVFLNLQAIRQMDGEMVSNADIEYLSEQKSFKNLVVVMPLEAPTLGQQAIFAFSTVFRSALINTKQFNLVSSDAVDKADPEKIQATYKCSREECSSIVAQQLNASWVITASYIKITSNLYYLSGTLKDISTGRTLSEESVKHDGNLETLEKNLEKLACELAGTCGQQVMEKTRPVAMVAQPNIIQEVTPYFPDTITDTDTGLMWQNTTYIPTLSWSEAESYCKKLNLRGYRDWRLPKAAEFKNFENVKTSLKRSTLYYYQYFWTGTKSYRKSAFMKKEMALLAYLDFENPGSDTIDDDNVNNEYSVRCTREYKSKNDSSNAYLGSQTKFVLDEMENFVWLKTEPKEMNWQEANAFCANQKTEKYANWKLPSEYQLDQGMQVKNKINLDNSSYYWVGSEDYDSKNPTQSSSYVWSPFLQIGGQADKDEHYSVICISEEIPQLEEEP